MTDNKYYNVKFNNKTILGLHYKGYLYNDQGIGEKVDKYNDDIGDFCFKLDLEEGKVRHFLQATPEEIKEIKDRMLPEIAGYEVSIHRDTLCFGCGDIEVDLKTAEDFLKIARTIEKIPNYAVYQRIVEDMREQDVTPKDINLDNLTELIKKVKKWM